MYYIKSIVNYLNHSFKNKSLIKSNIFENKNSDTLFILGSGESINSIKIWDKISKHDSVGFNYFIFNNFVPNFYIFESTYPEYEDEYNAQLSLIEKKINKFKSIKVFLKISRGFEGIKKILDKNSINYKLLFELNFNSNNVEELKTKITHKKYNLVKDFLLLGQGVASIERLCLKAFFSGYKKIVLCGVDLNNSRYFFEKNQSFTEDLKKISNKIIESKDMVHKGNKHITSDTKYCKGGIVVQDVLSIYQKYVFKNKSQIFVESENSLLKQFFPLYNYR